MSLRRWVGLATRTAGLAAGSANIQRAGITSVWNSRIRLPLQSSIFNASVTSMSTAHIVATTSPIRSFQSTTQPSATERKDFLIQCSILFFELSRSYSDEEVHEQEAKLKQFMREKAYLVDSETVLIELIVIALNNSATLQSYFRVKPSECCEMLVLLIHLLSGDQLRMLIPTQESLNRVLARIGYDLPSSLLLIKLGQAHVTSITTDFAMLCDLWQANVLNVLTPEKMRSFITSFDTLRQALAWCGNSNESCDKGKFQTIHASELTRAAIWDKAHFRGPGRYATYDHTTELLTKLGLEYVMGLIKNGLQLASLTSNERVYFGTKGDSSNRIDAEKILAFLAPAISQVKINGPTPENQMSAAPRQIDSEVETSVRPEEARSAVSKGPR